MATFEEYIEELLEEEGGSTVTDDPNDSGGLTKFGISQKAYPNLDIENLTEEEAREIYKRDYWDRMNLDKMPEHLRRDLFFAGVNMGVNNPLNKALQRAVGAKPDGWLGDNTAEAVSKFEDVGSISRNTLVEGAIDYYVDLAERRPKDRKFLNGWMNRVLGTEARPFGQNAIDLRDMAPDQIREVAKQRLAAVTPEYKPTKQPPASSLRDARPNTEDTRGPLEGLMTGFVDNLTQLIGQRLEAPQSASQTPSEARTEPEQQEEQPVDRMERLLYRGRQRIVNSSRQDNEAQLERTANEAQLAADADAALEESRRKKVSLLDRAKERQRATGTRETQPPVRVNRGTMEERDDSLDPTYGIF